MTRFSAGTEEILARIQGRSLKKARDRDMFRLFAQEIDYFTDDWTTDAHVLGPVSGILTQ
jgi:hypothetical protein